MVRTTISSMSVRGASAGPRAAVAEGMRSRLRSTAVGQQRNLAQLDEMMRHHVVGQRPLEKPSLASSPDALPRGTT